ncbi:hypothetical protein NKR23_g6285 [Pleurostoma richardsiae]|uniref:Uncharacterized protein n=1 Tax=Pleurostoma richardsiae TaxID=41990 RepID=A0AA38VPB7_9PEZI|nr:hypothetical protein NKR23_g6285 [Pleurostoma richardsiae]
MTAFRATFLSLSQRAVARQPLRLQTTVRVPRRGYSDVRSQKPSDKKAVTNLPLIAVFAAVAVGGLYFVSAGQKSQKDVPKDSHAGQKIIHGAPFQNRENEPSAWSGKVSSEKAAKTEDKTHVAKSDVPDDAPNKAENFAKEEDRLTNKPPSKRVSPLT